MTTPPDIEPEKRKRRRLPLFGLGGFLLLLLVWLVLGVGNYCVWCLGESSDGASKFGESFGFVNSLFSGLALVGVVAAIILQRKELTLQRAELKMTREELAKSATAQTQLVHLSALSTLLQTYLEEYKLNTHYHEEEFKQFLKDEPAKAKDNLWYRILILRAELEAINAKAAGQTFAMTDNSIESHRRQYWYDQFEAAISQFEKRWEPTETDPDLLPDIEGRRVVETLVGRLEKMQDWIDAVPEGDAHALHLLIQSLREFHLNITVAPYDSPDDEGQHVPRQSLLQNDHAHGKEMCAQMKTWFETTKQSKPDNPTG